ncbi:hypothetical protein CMV_003706 [Castanea mollissima]|uniref:Uncharacterized protein n=1 Tax=Castanea mollissima TaxID=60419 RepID=A0A8J4VW89_9ROSI|nr:hypothetical protein CMV_003706 [Castanea mollissima]
MVSSGCEIGVGLVVAESKPSSALGSRRSDQEASGFLGSDPVLQTHDVDNFLQVQDLNPEAPRSFPIINYLVFNTHKKAKRCRTKRKSCGLCPRRACYGVLRFIMENGAKGCEVIASGKL